MTDFIKHIRNGTMMIRDTGGWVEFWFKTSNLTWNFQQTWGYQANGRYIQQDYRLTKDGAWHRFGSTFVESGQDVMFRIIDEGLGWPTTDFWQFIERGRRPDPPRPPYFGQRTSNSIHVAFDYNYDGGLPIREAEIWYSYDGTPRYLARNTRDIVIGGLSPKSRYFFWGKVRNDKGWSDLGPRSEARTVGVPDAPLPPDVFSISPTQVRGGVRLPYPWDGGSPVREWQIGYGTSPLAPLSRISGTRVDLNGLQMAKPYYFWARARNDFGWGAWSGRTSVTLISGAWVKHNGVWRRAVPWVKQGGVWRMARSNVFLNGAWRSSKP